MTKYGTMVLWIIAFGSVLWTSAGAAQAEPVKVRLGYATALHGEVAKVLAKTDIAKRHGLDVEATFFQYGPPQIEALVSKSRLTSAPLPISLSGEIAVPPTDLDPNGDAVYLFGRELGEAKVWTSPLFVRRAP